MPETIRLPDGSVIEIPDNLSIEERNKIAGELRTRFNIGTPSPQPQMQPEPQDRGSFAERSANLEAMMEARFPSGQVGIPSLQEPPPDEYGTEAGGTILGSAWEGIKSIPRGVRQFGLMALQGAEGLRTPDRDTDREKALRKRLNDLMMEVDPKYRDANLVHLGMGLGQVGGMIGLGAGAGALGLGGAAATGVAGVATALMGAGEQAGRMAEYEERTGEDISKAKEILSLGMGLGIGLSEIAPLGKYAKGIGLGRKGASEATQRVVANAADMTWGQIGKSAIRQARDEAIQEGLAGFGQSAVARYMYDEEAMADAGVEALREALIGGEVGAVTDLMLKMSARAVANVKGQRGNYDLNRRVQKRYEKRVAAGEFQEADIDRLITGPDLNAVSADVERRKQVAREEILARWESMPNETQQERDNAIRQTETEIEAAEASLDEELDAAIQEDEDLNALRASVFARDRDGNLIFNKDGSVRRKQGKNSLTGANKERAIRSKKRLADDLKAGTITQSEHDKFVGQIDDRLANFDREMLILGSTLALKESGIDAAQQKAAEATLEAQRIVAEPDDDILLNNELEKAEQERKEARKKRDDQRVGELDKHIEGIRNVLEPAAPPVPTLDVMPSKTSIPVTEVVDQVEKRLLPLTADKIIETEDKIDADVFKYTEQGAHLNERVIERRKELEKIATYDEDTGSWKSGVEAGPQQRQALANERGVIEGLIAAEEEAIRDELDHGLIQGTVAIDAEGNAEYDLTEAGKIPSIPAKKDGTPRKNAIHPASLLPATKTDIDNQRRSRREYNHSIKRRDELRTQLENATSPEDKVRRLEGGLKRDQALLDSLNEGDVVIEPSTLDQLASDGVKTAKEELAKSLKAIDVATEKKMRKEFPDIDPPQRDKDGNVIIKKGKPITKLSLAEFKEEAIKQIRNSSRDRIVGGLKQLQSEEYQNRRINEAYGEIESRPVLIDTLSDPADPDGNFELEEYLVSPEQREAYRELAALSAAADADAELSMTPAEATSYVERILGGEGISLRWTQSGRTGRQASPHRKTVPAKAVRRPMVSPIEAKPSTRAGPRGTAQEGRAHGRTQAKRAVDAILGLAAIDPLADVIEEEGMDQRPPKDWVGITLGKLADGRIKKLIEKLQKSGYDLTENVFKELLGIKNFSVSQWKRSGSLFQSKFFKELISDTLGTDVDWSDLGRGQQEMVFERVLRTEPIPDRTKQAKKEKEQLAKTLREVSEGIMADVKPQDQIVGDAKSIEEASKRVKKYKDIVTRTLKKLGLENVIVEFTANVDDMMAQVKDVIINGAFVVEMDENGKVIIEDGKPKLAKDANDNPIYRPTYEGGAVASLQNYGNRIVFNLSQIVGKHKEADIETLIKDAVAHEGAHIHFVRQWLNDGDRKALDRYGRTRVPKEVDSNAHERGLTWREYVGEVYTDENNIPRLEGEALTEETSVHILDALVQDKIPVARTSGLIGKIKRQLKAVFGAIASSAEEADILPVLEVFEKLQNVDTMKRRREKAKSPDGVMSLHLIERARPEDAKRLRDAVKDGDPAKIDEAIDIILDSTFEFSDPTLTPHQRLQESLISELSARRQIEGTPNFISPMLNAKAIEDGDIDLESLNAYFRFKDGRKPAYRMPTDSRELRLFRFGKTDVVTPSETEASNQRFIDEGWVEGSSGVSGGEQIVNATDYHNQVGTDEDGRPKFVGTRADFEKMMEYSIREKFRLNFADRRLATWKSSKRAWQREIAKYGEVLSRLAENSAVAAWRIADNAMNFIPGVMSHGMIVYVDGGFRLQRDVKGLHEIIGPLVEMGEAAEVSATIYMAAKRVVDLQAKREVARQELDALIQTGASVDDIIAARRNKESWEQAYDDANPLKTPRQRNIPIDDAKAEIARIESSEAEMDLAIVQFGKEYATFNHHVIQFGMDTGLVSIERGEIMQELSFIPFYRDMGWENNDPMSNSENENVRKKKDKAVSEGAEKEVATRGGPLIDQQIRGSLLPISTDLFGNLQRNVQAMIRDGMTNIATTRSMRDEVANGTAELLIEPSDEQLSRQRYLQIQKEKYAKLKTQDMPQDMATELTELNATITELNEQRSDQMERLKKRGFSSMIVTAKGISTDLNNENQTTGIEEAGISKSYLVLDPELSRAIMSIGFSPQQAIEDFFGKAIKNERLRKGLTKLVVGPAKILREAVVRSPPFVIKNIIRDSWQASVNYGGGPALFFKAMANFATPDILVRAEERGLGIAVDWQADPNDPAAVDIRKKLKKQKRGKLSSPSAWLNPLDWAVNLWDVLGDMSKRSEVATRMAVYDNTMAKTDGNAAESLHQAIEIINYGRRGASPMFAVMTAMSPFLNGRIQGLDVTYRTHAGSMDAPGLFGEEGVTDVDSKTLRTQRQLTAVSRGALFIGATAMYYFMVKDDEEYKNTREDLKNDWWLIPMGNGLHVKIPIPFEVGTLYKVIPEQILRMMFEQEHDVRDVRDEMARQIKGSLMMDLRPQFIRPMIDAWSNKDAYQRDAIVPQWMEDTVMASEQYNPYTSMITRLVGDKLNDIPFLKNVDFLNSPMKLEYMMRQYGGTLGSYLFVAADRLAREATDENVVGTSADFGFDWRTVASMPMLGDLLYDAQKGGGFQEDFYEAVEDMNTLVTTLGQIKEGRGYEEAKEFEQEHKGMFDAKRRLQYFERRMKHYRTERDRLFERTDLSDDDKRRQLFRMFEIRDDMLAEMVNIMGDIREERSVMEAALGTRP
jgi:hypothetical protein|tara:strand:+ start:2600 stop:10795 length:8196 start_codon:yes stop_codon:yes gene_type:complete